MYDEVRGAGAPLTQNQWLDSAARYRATEGVQDHTRLVRDDTEAPDGVPSETVLTTEVDDATVTQLNREADGVTECVVTDHDRGVREGVGGLVATRTCVDVSRDREALSNLRGLDEDDVVDTTDLAEHEVAGGGVLRDLDELGPVTQRAGLCRVHEADVGVAEARDVLAGQNLDGVLDGSRGQVARRGCGTNGTCGVRGEGATGRSSGATEHDVRSYGCAATERYAVGVQGVAHRTMR